MEHYESTTLGFDPFPPTGVQIFPNKTSKPGTTPADTFAPLVRWVERKKPERPLPLLPLPLLPGRCRP